MKTERRLGRRLWLAVLFSAIGLVFIFRSLENLSWQSFWQRINWFYVLLGFGALLLVWSAKAWRMFIITAGMGGRVGLFRLLQIYLATCFLSHVTPFSSGGTPLQIFLLHQQGLSAGKAAAVTVVDLGLNTLFFVLLVPIALVVNFHLLKGIKLTTPDLRDLLGVGLIILALVLILIYAWRKGIWRHNRWLKRLHHYLSRKGWLKKLHWEYSRFKEGLHLLVSQNRNAIWWALLANLLYWVFYLLLAPLSIWALGRRVSFFKLIGWQLLFNFGQILIPTPGGSGGSELLLAYLFKGFTGAANIGAFVLLWKTYTFFSTLILGGYCFVKLTRLAPYKEHSKNSGQ